MTRVHHSAEERSTVERPAETDPGPQPPPHSLPAASGDPEAAGPGDAELVAAVRVGTMQSYELLYRRHVAAARNLARQLTRSRAEADDLVAEAFARMLDTLRGGGGPDTAFRAYLLTTLRHCQYDKTRRDRRVEYSDDLSQIDPGEPFVDTALEGLEARLVARAFGSLPERWQTVLWHTEVEGETPAQIAPLLGLSPNGVSALAYRAREGLRQAYLQVHLQDAAGERCRHAVERLGAWARWGLSKRERAQVDAHLDSCERCRALGAELTDVNRGLRSVIAPLVIGAPWLAGYLAAGGKAAAAGGVAMLSAGGGAAAAAGLGAGGAAAAAAAGAAAAGGAAAGGAAAGGGAAGLGVGAGGGAVAGGAVAAGAGGVGGLGAGGGAAAVGGGLSAGGVLAHAAGLLAKVVGTPLGQATVGAASVGAAVAVGVAVVPAVEAPHHRPAMAPGGVAAPTTHAQIERSNPQAPARSTAAVGTVGSRGRAKTSTTPGAGPGTSASPGGPTISGGPPPTGGQQIGGPALRSGYASTGDGLQQGQPGVITISVRNTGADPATNLVADISLPSGIVLRGGSNGNGGNNGTDGNSTAAPARTPEPAGYNRGMAWTCNPTPAGATCTLPTLAAGDSADLDLNVFVARDAQSGMLTGTIGADGGYAVQVTPTGIAVAPA